MSGSQVKHSLLAIIVVITNDFLYCLCCFLMILSTRTTKQETKNKTHRNTTEINSLPYFLEVLNSKPGEQVYADSHATLPTPLCH